MALAEECRQSESLHMYMYMDMHMYIYMYISRCGTCRGMPSDLKATAVGFSSTCTCTYMIWEHILYENTFDLRTHSIWEHILYENIFYMRTHSV